MMNRRDFTMSALGVAAAAAVSNPNRVRAAVQPGSLKQRVHAGEPLRIERATTDLSRSELEKIVKRGPVDLFKVDGQHGPVDERELLRFCTMAEELGAGVKFRIKHPRQAFLLGNYADLGPLSIMVPLVEDEQTAQDAVDAFYYPPFGKRSWGGQGFRRMERYGSGRLEYAAWWNANAVLCLQVESVAAAVNVRKLVKPGVDWIQFGPADLSFDLERHSHSPFKSVDECVAYVKEQLQGVDVRVGDPLVF
jgi:2-keto-3-deoxy-L-rhamnonate aldolase RhmA